MLCRRMLYQVLISLGPALRRESVGRRCTPRKWQALPASRLQELGLRQFGYIDSAHCFAELLARFEYGFGVPKMDGRLYDCSSAGCGICRFETPRTPEDRLCSKLHAQSGIRWSRNSAGGEIRNRQPAVF